ncbi:MAG: hypothetical protein LCH73_02765 [Proteobacteria bacterium]|nr:hypothetical protein [Pseudomonadota bacterium]
MTTPAIHAVDIDIGRAIVHHIQRHGPATAKELADIYTENGRIDTLGPVLRRLAHDGRLQVMRPKWQAAVYHLGPWANVA